MEEVLHLLKDRAIHAFEVKSEKRQEWRFGQVHRILKYD